MQEKTWPTKPHQSKLSMWVNHAGTAAICLAIAFVILGVIAVEKVIESAKRKVFDDPLSQNEALVLIALAASVLMYCIH